VTWGLKARTVGPEEIPVVRERLCKFHVTVDCGGRGNATIEELWKEEFSVQSVAKLYKED
jgi:hypothetical protein